MKTRFHRPTVVSLSLFALLAAACGGQANTESNAQSLTANTPTANAVAPEGRGGFGHDPARFLARFDRNNDGVVRVDELPGRMAEHLGAADANHDGVLAADELTAFDAARRAEHFARMDANHDGAITQDEAGERWNFVSAADADHDGRITSAELDAARASGLVHPPGGGMGRHGFGGHGFGPRGPMNPADVVARFDRDGNGSLEVSELPAMMRAHFTDADANHDGVISVDELAAKEREMHAHRFARIDTNGDGALTETEVPAERWAHIHVADVNGDGRVTQVELETAMENGTLAPPPPAAIEPAD